MSSNGVAVSGSPLPPVPATRDILINGDMTAEEVAVKIAERSSPAFRCRQSEFLHFGEGQPQPDSHFQPHDYFVGSAAFIVQRAGRRRIRQLYGGFAAIVT